MGNGSTSRQGRTKYKYDKMDILKLSAEEARMIGFHAIYVWDSFKVDYTEVYDEITDQVQAEVWRCSRERRDVIRNVGRLIKERNIDVNEYSTNVKIRREANRQRAISSQGAETMETMERENPEQAKRIRLNFEEAEKERGMVEEIMGEYKRSKDKKGMMVEFVEKHLFPTFTDGFDIEFMREMLDQSREHLDLEKITEWAKNRE